MEPMGCSQTASEILRGHQLRGGCGVQLRRWQHLRIVPSKARSKQGLPYSPHCSKKLAGSVGSPVGPQYDVTVRSLTSVELPWRRDLL